MKVQINGENFCTQIINLFSSWEENPTLWGQRDVVGFCLGKITEESPDNFLSSTVFTWLLGYQFTETVIVFVKRPERVVYFQTSKKKATILNSVEIKGAFRIEVLERTTNIDADMENLLKVVHENNDKLGIVREDISHQYGDYVNNFLARVKKLNLFDISHSMRTLFSVKSNIELTLCKKSAKFTTIVLDRFVRKKLEDIINEERSISCKKFSEELEGTIDTPSSIGLRKLNPSDVTAIPPILVASGPNVHFDAFESSDSPMEFNTINVLFGSGYKSYASILGRTYMIDPSAQQEKDYNFVAQMMQHCVNLLEEIKNEEDVTVKNFGTFYRRTMQFLRDKRPDLEEYFTGNLGRICGLEGSEHVDFEFNSDRNHVKLGDDMVLTVKIAFENIVERGTNKSKPGRDKYSLLIANTIHIPKGNLSPKYLTGGDVLFKKVAYSLEEDEDVEIPMVDKSNILETRTRHQKKKAANVQSEYERKRKQHQILKKKQRDFLAPTKSKKKEKVKTGTTIKKKQDYSVERELSNGSLSSYKSHLSFPKYRKNKIVVDDRNDSILLPIQGQFTPFHVATIQSVTSNEESDHTYMRFNFKHPKTRGKTVYMPAQDHPQHIFVKEMSFRSKDKYQAEKNIQRIKNLQKRVRDKEKDVNNQRKTIKQEKLVLTRGTMIKLKDVHMRPTVGRGRKTIGRLECHENGLRFISSSSSKSGRVPNIEIIFSNVRNCFYQSADKEVIVVIHFHLKNPVIIGKKLQKDIQFYTKVMDDNEQLTGRFRRTMSDRESIYEEKRERELKERLNVEFYNFCKQVQGKSGLVFEIPFRELAFTGTPFKQSSTLIPTSNCLVNLTDYPFFVCNVEDVQVAVLERVQFGLRNFDLTFILEDLGKKAIQITTVPKNRIDVVRDWLTKVEVKYFEVKMNYQWSKVLQSIRDMGNNWFPWGQDGWVSVFHDGEDYQEEDDEEDEADAYKPPSDDEESDSEDEVELIENPEDLKEEEEEDEEEETVAPTWGELAKEAKAADRKTEKRHRGFGYGAGEEPKTKKRKF